MEKFINGEHILKMKPFKNITDGTVEILSKLDEIATNFDKKKIYYRSEMLKKLIQYNVEGSWVDRFTQTEKFGRDSSSIESYIARYGDIIGKKLCDEKLKKSTVTESTYITKYGLKKGKLKWKELCNSKISYGEDACISRHGATEGKKIWKDRLQRKLSTEKKNFENKPHRNGLTLSGYQNKYGIEDGYKRWDTKRKMRKHTMSLDGCVEKYGNDAGTQMYKKYVDQMVSNLSNKNGGYSKISQKLFDSIYDAIPIDKKTLCKYAIKNGEARFFMNDNSLILVDFKCGNCIIEFDGDYWHSFENTKHRDSVKQLFLESKGYKILRIWESEYKTSPEAVVEKCIKFIEEKYERP